MHPTHWLISTQVGAVAGRLRRDLLATRTSEKVQARGAFFRGAQKLLCRQFRTHVGRGIAGVIL